MLHTLPWRLPFSEGWSKCNLPVQWVEQPQCRGKETLHQMLCCRGSHQLALRSGSGQQATYGQLLDFFRNRCDLRSWGIGPGDRVAYIVDEGPVSAVLFLALLAQCTAAPVAPSEDLEATLQQLQIRLTIAMETYEEKIASAVRQLQKIGLPELDYTLVKETPDFAGSFCFERPPKPRTMPAMSDAQETALLLRTSGTTSKPKVVPLRLGALTSNGSAIANSLHLTPQDVCINAMPLFHIGGLSASLLATLASGGSVICMPGFQPEEFLNCITGELQPTWYSAVPTIHMALLQHLEMRRAAGESLSHSLRFIRSGAANLSAEAAVSLRRAWGCRVLPTYSMSEQMPISQAPADYDLIRPGSVGLPMLSLVIVDSELRPLLLADPPNIGEICISGPNVMEGYENNFDANAQSFFILGNCRYFRTGDLGHLDKDGYLFLAGRQKELIKVGGEQVSPYELEDFISQHAAVKIALVFGVPDELRGEVVCAAVVLHDTAQAQEALAEVRQTCMEKLPSYKVPRLYAVNEDQLVLNSSKKYVRKALAQALGIVGEDGKITPSRRTEPPKATDDTAHAESETGVLSDATLGIRFFLSIIVCLNHIGDHAWPYESHHSSFSASVSSARTVGDIGVVCFGLLAGFSLSA